jgi:hypothetical protein
LQGAISFISGTFFAEKRPFMPLEVLELTDKHQQLLDRLCELIPDLDSESPQSLQRIFGLGLIALTMQLTNKARQKDQSDLVEELGQLAREMVEAEQWQSPLGD